MLWSLDEIDWLELYFWFLYRNEVVILVVWKDKDIIEKFEIMEVIRRVGFLGFFWVFEYESKVNMCWFIVFVKFIYLDNLWDLFWNVGFFF